MAKELLNLPDELLHYVNMMLTFEDRVVFGQTCRRLQYITGGNRSYAAYDTMQISDDHGETFLFDSRGRKPKLLFKPQNARMALSLTKNLQEITILMKEVDMSRSQDLPQPSPYTKGGYLGCLLGHLQNKNLRKISLHVDMMIDTIAGKHIFAPFEDLHFAFRHLANQPFETVIQLSLCCAQFTEQDTLSRDFLVKSMQNLLKLVHEQGAKTAYDPSPTEGYVDMNVEYGNLEYNFSFFYYNPEMCEGTIEEGSR